MLFDTRMPSAQELPADIRPLAYRQSQTLDSVRFNEDVMNIVLALRPVLQEQR